MVAEVSPAVIVHLAAVIPPLAYRDAAFARTLNVDATAALVRAAENQPIPPRFLHASSAGDESHRLRQGEIAPAMVAAQGMVGVVPQGRPGDPNSDDGWYPNADRMDVAAAQRVLRFQHHSWPDMLAEMRAQAGWKRHTNRLIVPLARQFLKNQAAYRK